MTRAHLSWLFLFIVTVSFSAPMLSWIGTCEAEDSLPLAELRGDAKAEREEELLYLREETVSIAARHEQPISEAPSNVYVITDDDIRRSGATDLPTVLRRIPGLEVMQVTGADFNVSVRGDNQLVSNKLLVMVDGRSIYVDVQGSVFWKAIPVTLPEIKRIEVQKGPASVLYGFNAFDGIINIITKSPEEMKGATAQFGGGTYGTINSAAVYANRYKKLGFRLSYGHDQTQQWRNGSALAYRDNKFNVHTEYALGGESKLSFSGGLVNANDTTDGFVTSAAVNTGGPSLGFAHVSYEQPNFLIRAFWNSYDIDGPVTTNPLLASFLRFTDQRFNSDRLLRGNTYNIEAQQRIEFANTTHLTIGINYRHNALSHNFIDRFRTEDRLGFYLQSEWKLSHMFQMVGGVRYDLDTFISPTLSPRGSLLFTPAPNHTIRATVALGFRPPTFFETYGNNLTITTLPLPFASPSPVNVRGSGNLGPEKIISYEVEYQGWYVQHRLRTRASIFYNYLSDLITTAVPAPTQGGVADIYGGEASLEFLATKWFSGFGNFSYQEVSQTLTGTSQRAGPRFKYNAGLRAQWENGLSGEIAYHWVGAAMYPLSPAFSMFSAFGVVPPDPYVGNYHLLNLRGAYRFWQEAAVAGYRREAEVAVSVFNALNDVHREHPLGDLIGSRVMGWLTLRY
ncbi:MAG: TonB-dependent receptor [Nitrospira sp.]|nr:TonB-dependent receptor [Nitrospira sp.]